MQKTRSAETIFFKRNETSVLQVDFPSNMPIRLATTLRKDCFYNPDICVVFMESKKKANCSHIYGAVQEEEN